MAYRDDQEAVRARLDATEARLRETEEALVEARRELADQHTPRIIATVARRAPRKERPFASDLNRVALGLGWELTCATFIVITCASLFSFQVLSGLAAGISLLAALAALALLRWWLRLRTRRALQELEYAVQEAPAPLRTRVAAPELPVDAPDDIMPEPRQPETRRHR